MALLAHWLGNVEQLPLENGNYSFPNLALRWMLSLSPRLGETARRHCTDDKQPVDRHRRDRGATWSSKFFDYLEANAEDYWQVPTAGGHR